MDRPILHEAYNCVARGPSELDRVVRAAMHARVPSDLPTAILFSGGVDSTLIAHYALEVAPDATAFFLGGTTAPDYEFATTYIEKTRMTMEVVNYGVEGNHDLARMKDVISSLEAFDPSVVRDAYCNHMLFERIHDRGFRVALTGEGADELFVGYEPIEVAYSLGEEIGNAVRTQTINLMHRANLQRLDRCGMRFRVEAREAFLDPRVVAYAMQLTPSELFGGFSRRQGKAALREIWDRYPGLLPSKIRDRRKTPLNVGCGFNTSQKTSPWCDFAEEALSSRELLDGQKQYAQFGIQTKEELLYMRMLADVMDVFRVPHLKDRPHLAFPVPDGMLETLSTRLNEYIP